MKVHCAFRGWYSGIRLICASNLPSKRRHKGRLRRENRKHSRLGGSYNDKCLRIRVCVFLVPCFCCCLQLFRFVLFSNSAGVVHDAIILYGRAVVEDVLAAVTHVHVSGKMHEMVLGDIGRQEIN